MEASLFYDTFNDTFDSSVQALKNLSSFSTFTTSVRLAAEIEPDQHEGLDRTLDEVMSQLRIQFPDHDEKYIPASPEERARAVEEWANQHRSSAPPLPDTAISRYSIYGDREDRQL